MYVMFCYYDIRCNGTTQYGRPTHGDPQATHRSMVGPPRAIHRLRTMTSVNFMKLYIREEKLLNFL